MTSVFVPASVTNNSVSLADNNAFTPNPGLQGHLAQGFGGTPTSSSLILQDREYQTTKDESAREDDPALQPGNPASHQIWSESPFVHYVKSNLSGGQLNQIQQPLDTVKMGRPTPKYWIRYDNYTMEKEGDIFGKVFEAENVEGNTSQQAVHNRPVYLQDEMVKQYTTEKSDLTDKITKAPMTEIAGKTVQKEKAVEKIVATAERDIKEEGDNGPIPTEISQDEHSKEEQPQPSREKKIRQRYSPY